MSTSQPFVWRLNIVMAEREVRTTRDLRRRLKGIGFEISEAQLGRVRHRLPARLDMALLAALCTVLETTPGTLLRLVANDAHAKASETTPPVEGRDLDSDSMRENEEERGPVSYPSVGPKARAVFRSENE